MICPTCQNVMIVVEWEKIELDYCTSCLGVWFDAGEIELLMQAMALDESILSLKNTLARPETPTAEKKRKCPVCSQKMKKVNLGDQPEVLIDACPIGEGIWFDGGEVQAVIKQCARQSCSPAGAPGRLISFLGDTLKSAKKPGTAG